MSTARIPDGTPFGYHDLERCALGFVLEAETWPVFIAWARQNHVSSESHDWLESGPDLAEIRLEWLRQGAAEECSAERQRAPDRQPVAPAEGRAWETPATRTV